MKKQMNNVHMFDNETTDNNVSDTSPSLQSSTGDKEDPYYNTDSSQDQNNSDESLKPTRRSSRSVFRISCQIIVINVVSLTIQTTATIKIILKIEESSA